MAWGSCCAVVAGDLGVLLVFCIFKRFGRKREVRFEMAFVPSPIIFLEDKRSLGKRYERSSSIEIGVSEEEK